jgi:50S ribosomal protein L16 3-hydroxylase
MGVLQSWLGGLPLPEFRSSYLGKVPFAQAGTAAATLSVLTWQSLDQILSAPDTPDLLVVAKGKPLDLPAPRSLGELERLFAEGLGIVVRHPERQCANILALTRAFADELPGDQRVLLFATAKGTHGFGWHYDPEDVFIIQNAGDKEYYFRRNTIDPTPARAAKPDFTSYLRETTPMMSCRMVEGDFLYLPRGYWHVAHPHAHALSLSIGVFPQR